MHLCYNEYLLSLPAPVHVLSLLLSFTRIYISICIFINDIYNANIYYIHSPLYFYYCFNPVSDYLYPLPNPSILLLPPSLFISIYFTHHTYYYPNPLPLYIYYYFQRFSCIFISTSHPFIVYLMLPRPLLFIYCYFAPFYCV